VPEVLARATVQNEIQRLVQHNAKVGIGHGRVEPLLTHRTPKDVRRRQVDGVEDGRGQVEEDERENHDHHRAGDLGLVRLVAPVLGGGFGDASDVSTTLVQAVHQGRV